MREEYAEKLMKLKFQSPSPGQTSSKTSVLYSRDVGQLGAVGGLEQKPQTVPDMKHCLPSVSQSIYPGSDPEAAIQYLHLHRILNNHLSL